MSFSLLPDLIFPALTDVTPQALMARGIELLLLDFDNTIVPYTTDVPTERMETWLREMQKSGIRLCVVSNSKKPRVQVFCKAYGLDCITTRRSPSSAASARQRRNTALRRSIWRSWAIRSTPMFWARTAEASPPFWSAPFTIIISG